MDETEIKEEETCHFTCSAKSSSNFTHVNYRYTYLMVNVDYVGGFHLRFVE